MQIKYRITIVFSVIVTVILLLFCITLYFFSYKDRTTRFKERLENQANSTIELVKSPGLTTQLFYSVTKNSPVTLKDRSILVYDYVSNKNYRYNDKGVASVVLGDMIVQKAAQGRPYFFKLGEREAVALEYKDNSHDYIVLVAAIDAESLEWFGRLRIIMLLCLLAGLLIILSTGYIFSISLVSAISEFTQKIQHISSERFSLRLETGKGKDELQKLAITINDLLDRLQASFNLQRRFIDNASHELSTPLASIASQMDVALQKERSSEDYKKALLSINDDVRRLSLLVRSLLEIAKVSGSMGGTELTSVRVDELLMRIPSELNKINASYEVKMEFEELPDDESTLIIYGNEHLLYSAIKNIVHNACKFSEDSSASLILGFTEKYIVIRVVDNGPGIDDHDLKNIFQPFYRSNRHESYISGAGLGLSLAHRIIGLHRGHIEVESEIGEGTTFIIYLPIEGLQDEETNEIKGLKQTK